jgi:hypothetical protein
MGTPETKLHPTSRNASRQVLASIDDVREAMVEVARHADRKLAILTQDLESEIFDHGPFVDVVKHMCLARSFARVRILVSNPYRTLRDGNRFVYLGRRLSSFIEFRHVHENYRDHHEAFMIADESALVFRADADRWEGIADTSEPAIARRYLAVFDEIWGASAQATEFRQLRI